MSDAIAKNIRHYRKLAGLTQEELANLANISTMSVRRYETLGDENREPSPSMLQNIADILGTNTWALTMPLPDDLECWMESYSKGNAPENSWRRESTLLEHFRKLNKAGELKAIEQVELLTKIPEYRKNNE